MLLTLKKRLWLIITLSTVLLVVSLVSLIKVDYTLTAPGYNHPIDDVIVIDDGLDESGSFHTTSVIVLDRMSYLQYWLGNLEKKVSVRENPDYYDDIDLKDLDYMSMAMKDDSLATSLIVAALLANKEITYESYITVYLTYNYLEVDTIELGDKIITVNGNDPRTEIPDVLCNEIARFEVKRGEEILFFDIEKKDIDGYCRFGLYTRTYSEIIDTEISYHFVDTNTGGPSGGLLQALYIYNELTTEDITHGLKIAGTGTINIEGNAGKIGGIEQKIITSVLNGIDVFFVPYISDSDSDNYIEAQRVLATLNSDMELVPVKTLQDALDYLHDRSDS